MTAKKTPETTTAPETPQEAVPAVPETPPVETPPETPQAAQEQPVATPPAQEEPPAENAPQAGSGEALPPEDVTTKAKTFTDAAAEVLDADPIDATPRNSTERLAAEGKTKGLTFAEQAAIAREQFGA